MTTDTTTTTTATGATTTATEIVDAYLAAWNEEDAGARAALVATAWTEEGRYVDPMFESTGHAGFSDLAAGVHTGYPGARFRRTTAVDAHHDEVRFGWELVAADGSTVVAGIDVGRIAADGRLASITGFFGDLAAEEVAA